jgi:hypothetical protein
MKMKSKRIYTALIVAGVALLVYAGCKQPYILPASSTDVKILVVEGLINTGADSTIVHLSRTVNLTDTAKSTPELNATIQIESDGNAVYPLLEMGNGYYFAPPLNLNGTAKYRLKIITLNNKVYQSDFVQAKNAPPVDSVNYEVKSNGIEIYSATHDATNKSRYYRWDFQETWVIHAEYSSLLKALNHPKDTIVYKDGADLHYTCWSSDASSTIVLNSSAKLSEDFIAHNPVAFVPSNSEKLKTEYSILVRQYALTKEAFDYFQNLKLNTEQLGSIFDAQPSQLTGNVHSVSNPNEPVLGYVSAGTSTQKRLFIGNSSLPPQWDSSIASPYTACGLDSLYFKNPKTGNNDVLLLYQTGLVPVTAIFSLKRELIGYSASTPFCTDCTFRGSSIRPSYWIDKL